MKKRLLSTLLTLCVVLALLPVTALAATSGTCGETAGWTLDDDGYLAISGTGLISQPENMQDEWVGRVKTIEIGLGVTGLDTAVFQLGGCVTKVILPDTLTTIGDAAFYLESKLEELDIPDGVTTIGDGAFFGCRSLSEITLPDGLTSIGEMAFTGVDVSSVTVPSSVTSIGAEALGYRMTDSFEAEKIPDFTIQGYAGTAAEEYALANDFAFTDLSAASSEPAEPEQPSEPEPPAAPPATGTAYPSTQTVELDGEKVEFQMYALRDENGNPTNYVKVRDLALALNGTAAQFSVDWDGAVNLVAGTAYTANGSENSTPFSGERAYKAPTSPTNVNGEASDLQAIMLTDDDGGGYTYYQLRDLGRKLGFNVDWSSERGVFIETDKPYAES